jgi:pimeloyl-ACP methyl ester carboxylesterase
MVTGFPATTVTFTPATGFSGAASFQFTLANASDTSNTATATITVSPGPAPSISSVSPNPPTGSNSAQPFAINGNTFVTGANVTLRDLTAGQTFANWPASSFSSTRIVINPIFTTAAHNWSVEVINPDGQSSGQFPFPVSSGLFTTSVIGTGTWVPTWDNTQSYPYQYLKVANEIGDFSYSQYFPPKTTASCYTTSAGCPVMVFALPYDLPWNKNTRTAWTGDFKDSNFVKPWCNAADDSCSYWAEDVYSPGYVAGMQVGFFENTDQANALNPLHDYYTYLVQGYAVMAVYGRFSAGRNIIQSVFDMRAGLGTLANQTHIDLARVGVEGTSWGGFEALYLAAYPPAGVTPRVGVAIAPVTDFQTFNTQATVTTPAATSGIQQTSYATFYDKYLRRIHNWTDANGYGLFQASTVMPRVTQSFLIMQDDWDTLIPSQITKNALAYAPAAGNVKSLSFPRHTAVNLQAGAVAGFIGCTNPGAALSTIDHNIQIPGTILQLLADAFLEYSLLPAGRSYPVMYKYTDLQNVMSNWHAYQSCVSYSSINQLSTELWYVADPRVSVYDLSDATKNMAGNALVAQMLNSYWTTELMGCYPSSFPLTASNVQSFLASKGIPHCS